MQIVSLSIGILAFVGMLIAFIPCLGWLNWFVLPLAFIGLILSIITTATDNSNKNFSSVGIILCAVVLIFGSIRWALGGFFL
jgi:hypothetical protein